MKNAILYIFLLLVGNSYSDRQSDPEKFDILSTHFNSIEIAYLKRNFASFVRQNIAIIKFSSDSVQVGKAHYYLGFYYYNQENDAKQSLKHLKKSLQYLSVSYNKKYLCKTYAALGSVYFGGSDYLTAEQLFLKSLKLSIKYKLISEQFKSQIYLGIIAKINGDYDNALMYFKKAGEISDKQSVRNSFLAPAQTCSSNLANIYLEKGNLRQAELGYLSVIKSCKRGEFEVYAKALDNLADVYRRERKISKAFALLRKSSNMRKTRNITEGEINNLYILSKCFFDSGDKSSAIRVAKKGIAMSIKQPQIKASFLEILISSHKCDEHNYSAEYIKISDSLQLAERRNRNKFARIAFETDELAQQKDNAVKEKKMAIATGSGLLICSVLLLVIKIQRARQKELLHAQQQEKTDRAIYDLVNEHRLQLDRTRQQEKNRIARELHDGVMNRLSSTRLNLYVLNTRRDDDTINKCVRLIDNLQAVEKELRQVAHDLSEDIFSGNKSFNSLLESLIDENRNLTDARFHVEIDENINWELCESAIKINVYRILQEALHNTRKYANANNIFITFSEMEGHLKMVLYDDGAGFVTGKKTKGIGLKNITSRVESLDGTIKILSAPGQGVAFNISIPLGRS